MAHRGGKKKLRLAVHVITADDGYDCNRCAHDQRCDEDGSRRWLDEQGNERRSRGPWSWPRWDFRAFGLGRQAVCPKPQMPDDWGSISTLLNTWRAGYLLSPGGIADQPAIYVDAMQAITNELAWIESERLKALSKPQATIPPRQLV